MVVGTLVDGSDGVAVTAVALSSAATGATKSIGVLGVVVVVVAGRFRSSPLVSNVNVHCFFRATAR